MKLLVLFLVMLRFVDAQILEVDIAPSLNEKDMAGIILLDQKQLNFEAIDGVKFSEISDLTYNQKNQKLYMLSDEGRLFAFDAVFSQKIEKLTSLSSATLTEGNGRKFKSWQHDSEGLALNNKGQLFASFEGRAKIGRFDEGGKMVQMLTLPLKLRDPKNYRSRNKSLESLAWHKRHGLLTVAEWPLKRFGRKEQSIYALNGKEWHFEAEAEIKSAAVAIEVMDDGNVLVLERSFSGIFKPLVVTLKKVYLNQCNNKQRLCKSEILAKMNNHKGWMIDNFEGLARVAPHRYVMISDDNDNFFQKTLLIYFEVKH